MTKQDTQPLRNANPRWRSYLPRRTSAFGMQIVSWVALLLLLIVPLFMTSPTARGEGLLPPGTTIGGMNVGGIRPDEVIAHLQPYVEEFSQREFRVTLLGSTYTFTAADIGLVANARATVQQVMLADTGGSYDMQVDVDPHQHHLHVSHVQSLLPNPGQNANVVMNGVTPVVEPAKDGETIDLQQYRSSLLASAPSDAPAVTIDISHREPPITTAEAQNTADLITTRLQQPLVLTAGEQEWTIGPVDLAEAINVVLSDDGALAVQWNLDVLLPRLEGVASEVESIEARDSWVQDLGTHSWIVPERQGMTVDWPAFIEAIQQALDDGAASVSVPVSITEVGKTTEDVKHELGITTLLASGTSVYEGSGSGRAHNVETATYYINRTLVPPGGEYSFNDSVGSLFSGEYMDAGSFIDGPNGTSLAGGVCQVSTTVFRAALNAGFPITERWPHSYRVGFYERGGWDPGFDAAIVQDLNAPHESTDLRFSNPTDSWLLVNAYTDGETMTVDIWGEDTGYDVLFSETSSAVAYHAPTDATVMVDAQLPAGTLSHQEAMDGLDVSFSRTVYGSDGTVLLSDTWNTTYYATGPIIRVSPDMEDGAYAYGG